MMKLSNWKRRQIYRIPRKIINVRRPNQYRILNCGTNEWDTSAHEHYNEHINVRREYHQLQKRRRCSNVLSVKKLKCSNEAVYKNNKMLVFLAKFFTWIYHMSADHPILMTSSPTMHLLSQHSSVVETVILVFSQ